MLASSDVYNHIVFDIFVGFFLPPERQRYKGKQKKIDWAFHECECLINKEMLNEIYMFISIKFGTMSLILKTVQAISISTDFM